MKFCKFEAVCKFFSVLQCWLTFPYPRRLERLTICRWNYSGSTFFSVIFQDPRCCSDRGCELVVHNPGRGLLISCKNVQCSTSWADCRQIYLWLCNLECQGCYLIFYTDPSWVVLDVNLTELVSIPAVSHLCFSFLFSLLRRHVFSLFTCTVSQHICILMDVVS